MNTTPQTINHNTNVKIRKKTEFDQYRDQFSMRMKPVSQRFLKLLVKDLVDWAVHDDNALILKQFFLLKGISTSDVHRWRKKHEWFNQAVEFAKSAIGIRRELGALTKKFDARTVMKTMPNYCDEWKEAELWRARLKKLAEEPDRNVLQEIVEQVLAPIESTGLVPEKPKN